MEIPVRVAMTTQLLLLLVLSRSFRLVSQLE